MALDAQELQTAKHMLSYYSGTIPEVPADMTKIDAIIQGDEAAVRALVATFITDVMRPMVVKNINQLQASLSTQQAELSAVDTQISK